MAPRCAAWPARLNVSRLRVVHSPHDVCARWEASLPAPVAHQPLWELAGTSDGATLRASPVWPRRCESEWGGQCAQSRRGISTCVLAVRDALVLESGLVVNRTHRFQLSGAYRHLDGEWRADGSPAAPLRRVPAAACAGEGGRPLRRVYSFRQQYAAGAGHTLIQVLPLLLPSVVDAVRRDADARVLAPSAMFRALASTVLPEAQLLRTRGPVAADVVHLVVGRPPFSALFHEWPSGCLAFLRRPPPPLPAAAATGAARGGTLLFLPRGGTSRAGVRSIANEAEVVRATERLLARRAGGRMKVHTFEFSTLAAQQRAFSRAEIIIGAHGTAFSGLAFARQRVAVVEWGLARDSYSTAEYLGLDATYFQLQPKWSRNATVAECAATGAMDDCPWHLDADDVRRYLALVDELVRDKGAALLAPARGARVHVRTLDELRERAEALRVS